MPEKVLPWNARLMEAILRIRGFLFENSVLVGIAAAIIFTIWIIEYFFNGIVFLDWFERRWYVVVFILLIFFWGVFRAIRQGEAAWADLENRFPVSGNASTERDEALYV